MSTTARKLADLLTDIRTKIGRGDIAMRDERAELVLLGRVEEALAAISAAEAEPTPPTAHKKSAGNCEHNRAVDAEPPPPDVRGEVEIIVSEFMSSYDRAEDARAVFVSRTKLHEAFASALAARDLEIERLREKYAAEIRASEHWHLEFDKAEAALASERAKGVEAVAAERDACARIARVAAYQKRKPDGEFERACELIHAAIRARTSAQPEGERGT